MKFPLKLMNYFGCQHFIFNISLIQTDSLPRDTYFSFVFSYVCVYASVCVGRAAAWASHRAWVNLKNDVNVFMEIYKGEMFRAVLIVHLSYYFMLEPAVIYEVWIYLITVPRHEGS